ncbi:unnamed protein product [Calypogeia fissa]
MKVRQQRPIKSTKWGPRLRGPESNPAGPRLPGNQVRGPQRAPDHSAAGGGGGTTNVEQVVGHLSHREQTKEDRKGPRCGGPDAVRGY